MTREEFIAAYMERSGIADYRLDGERVYFTEGIYRLVLPCECGEEGCEGWAMVSPSGRDTHMQLYAPPQPAPTPDAPN